MIDYIKWVDQVSTSENPDDSKKVDSIGMQLSKALTETCECL